MFDNGKSLPLGLLLISNDTGRPEPVLTIDQIEEQDVP